MRLKMKINNFDIISNHIKAICCSYATDKDSIFDSFFELKSAKITANLAEKEFKKIEEEMRKPADNVEEEVEKKEIFVGGRIHCTCVLLH